MDELVTAARTARAAAYCPYSGYAVGAALLDEHGRVHLGVNFENASYGATICAERNAIGAMVTAGGRKVRAIAIATRDSGSPCGMCLQVLWEFADSDLPIALVDEAGKVESFALSDFLPRPFELKADSEPSERN